MCVCVVTHYPDVSLNEELAMKVGPKEEGGECACMFGLRAHGRVLNCVDVCGYAWRVFVCTCAELVSVSLCLCRKIRVLHSLWSKEILVAKARRFLCTFDTSPQTTQSRRFIRR